jgi:signal recognition particle GTPase
MLREVRLTLLGADVAVPVAKSLPARVKDPRRRTGWP